MLQPWQSRLLRARRLGRLHRQRSRAGRPCHLGGRCRMRWRCRLVATAHDGEHWRHRRRQAGGRRVRRSRGRAPRRWWCGLRETPARPPRRPCRGPRTGPGAIRRARPAGARLFPQARNESPRGSPACASRRRRCGGRRSSAARGCRALRRDTIRTVRPPRGQGLADRPRLPPRQSRQSAHRTSSHRQHVETPLRVQSVLRTKATAACRDIGAPPTACVQIDTHDSAPNQCFGLPIGCCYSCS